MMSDRQPVYVYQGYLYHYRLLPQEPGDYTFRWEFSVAPGQGPGAAANLDSAIQQFQDDGRRMVNNAFDRLKNFELVK